jgi:hypothetical protein
MELILGIFGSILVSLLANEIYDRGPTLARKMVRVAAKRLPVNVRERYEEEWLAHLDECDGKLSKLLHGLECVFCARTLGRPSAYKLGGDQQLTVSLDDNTAKFVVAVMGTVLEQSEMQLPQDLLQMWTDLSGEQRFISSEVDIENLRSSADRHQLEEFLSLVKFLEEETSN